MGEYQDLYDKIIRGCEDCPWTDRKSQTVPPEGPVPCRIMVIGRNPGETENQAGRPFVGPAGQALDRLLLDCELGRESIYITNTAKCYGGPGDPCPDETVFNTCESFLEQEISLVRPEILISLGSDAHRRLTCDLTPITRIQGSVRTLLWGPPLGGITLIPLTHPSFWIRSGNYYDRVIKIQVVPVLREVLDSRCNS